MAKIYDIVNTSKMQMEFDGSKINVTKSAKTALENGRLVAVDADGTVRYALVGDKEVYLHASVEKMADTTLGLTAFRAEAGNMIRMIQPVKGDVFASTAFAVTLVKGDKVIVGANGIFAKAGVLAGTENFVGEVESVTALGYDRIPAISIRVM